MGDLKLEALKIHSKLFQKGSIVVKARMKLSDHLFLIDLSIHLQYFLPQINSFLVILLFY